MKEFQINEYFEDMLNHHTVEEIVFAHNLTMNITLLESKIRSDKSLRKMTEASLKSAAEFYEADWACIVESVYDESIWSMLEWHNRTTREMTLENIREFLTLISFKRWGIAARDDKDIIILDVEELKESSPKEYAIFRKCRIHSIMATLCWHYPYRFLIICNPKKYMAQPRYLKTVGFLFLSMVTEWRLLEEGREISLPEAIKNDNDVVINLFENIEIYTKRGVLKEKDINSPKFCCVLVYLLLHKNLPVSSRKISEEIWPEEISKNQGDKVKSLISRFKKVFSTISDDPLLVSTQQGYHLNPELNIITDIGMFEKYYSRARKETVVQKKVELYQKALALYKGDILPLENLEHWLLPRQVGYKNMQLEMFNALMKIYFALNNFKSGEYYAWEILDKEAPNIDVYYWMICFAEGKQFFYGKRKILEMAKIALWEEEYEELLSRLQ